ncbi:MAG: hypothetical protein Q8922_11375 [Bacteroidota bacterium]|nr:hypothetical protein [Bacteroidota bacterium]MDP4233599.1 hypothetical protein [Bacteroidota bacterium]MDP4244092.1 hypothetical protein [Bacteroidota bacterium]MDP4288527.1 hypothetical protein [Bacteroidota bacterium]
MRNPLFIVLLLAGVSACKTEPPLSPGGKHQPLSLAPGMIIAGSDTISGVMLCQCLITENPLGASNVAGTYWTRYTTMAQFFDTTSTFPVSAGDVMLNGISIPASDNLYITTTNQPFATSHHWQVAGNTSGTVPSMDTTVQAPSFFHVTYPRPIIDTVSKTTGFSCTYGNPGTDSVAIQIAYDSVMTGVIDTGIHNMRPDPVDTVVPNTGSFFVGSAMLAAFPSSGVIQIFIAAYNYKRIYVASKEYVVAAVSRARTYGIIKN